MKTPISLTQAFTAAFEDQMAQLCADQGWITEKREFSSPRFLRRSILPHFQKLSDHFNERNPTQPGISAYWGKSSHPKNLRLAYLLGFMPPNAYRLAAIWSELHRLGFRWPKTKSFRAIEWGAGPATAVNGIAIGEKHAPLGLPTSVSWSLVEQDKMILEMGEAWTQAHCKHLGLTEWKTLRFPRKIEWDDVLLPRSAPAFDLWVMSFFLTETKASPETLAERLVESWTRHLNPGGLVILVEPALQGESRRLLQLRAEILKLIQKNKKNDLQILLPCLGHQACGALAKPSDWCHEEVNWMRPSYLKWLDDQAKLDHRSLPFSYLVLCRSNAPREQLLPAISRFSLNSPLRVVSGTHQEGQDWEFFVCGEGGKNRARCRDAPWPDKKPRRGDLLLGSEITRTSNFYMRLTNPDCI